MDLDYINTINGFDVSRKYEYVSKTQLAGRVIWRDGALYARYTFHEEAINLGSDNGLNKTNGLNFLNGSAEVISTPKYFIHYLKDQHWCE